MADPPLTPRTMPGFVAVAAAMYALGIFCFVTVVLTPVGVALVGYATLGLAWEFLRMAWHGLESFADWFYDR